MHNKGGGVHLKHFFYEKICTLEKKLVPLHPKNCLPCNNDEAAALLLLFKTRRFFKVRRNSINLKKD